MEQLITTTRPLFKLLFQSATAYIYSTPTFALETALLVVVSVLYIFLHVEITNITLRTCRLKPNSLYLSNRLRAAYSRDSDCTSITHVQHKIRINVSRGSLTTHFSCNNRRASSTSNSSNGNLGAPLHAGDVGHTRISTPLDLYQRIDRVLTMTPEEYIKHDCVRKARENDLVNCIKSLSTLYQDAVARKTSRQATQQHLELAREHLEQAKISSDTSRYLGRNADALTSSLFDLLEGIIMSSSPERPLPFKGDLTTLIFDAGNLTMKSSVGCNVPRLSETS